MTTILRVLRNNQYLKLDDDLKLNSAILLNVDGLLDDGRLFDSAGLYDDAEVEDSDGLLDGGWLLRVMDCWIATNYSNVMDYWSDYLLLIILINGIHPVEFMAVFNYRFHTKEGDVNFRKVKSLALIFLISSHKVIIRESYLD